MDNYYYYLGALLLIIVVFLVLKRTVSCAVKAIVTIAVVALAAYVYWFHIRGGA